MRCPMESGEGAELVLAFCARRLDPDKAEWYQRHLVSCASCRETVSAQRQVWDALDYWEALPVTQDFDNRLRWRVEAEEGKPWFERLSGSELARWLRPAIPMASVAAAALAVFLVRAPGPLDADYTHRLETAEVEQAERVLEDWDMIRQFTRPPREASNRKPI